MKKIFKYLFLLICSFLSLSSCGSSTTTSTSDNQDGQVGYIHGLNISIYSFEDYISGNESNCSVLSYTQSNFVTPGIKYYLLIEYLADGTLYDKILGETYYLDLYYSGANIDVEEANTVFISENNSSKSFKYDYITNNSVKKCKIGLFVVFEHSGKILIKYTKYSSCFLFNASDDFAFDIDRNTDKAIITAIPNNISEVTIPNKIGEYDVIGVAPFALYSTNINKVIIEEGVEYIDDFAFGGCINLNTIIAKGVKSVGSYAFYNCQSLKEIYLGKSLKSIGSYAFDGCLSLNTINYSSNIQGWNSIENNSDCSSYDVIFGE